MQIEQISDFNIDALLSGADILVDVREPDEYSSGTLPGAINRPLSDFDEALTELAQYNTVYVFCHTGGRSLDAAQRLQSAGLKNVVNLHGGVVGWQDAGNQLAPPSL